MKKKKKKIDPEQQAFIDALKENPKDQATHLVYADWLDEHDQPELADLERSWTVAKYKEAWLFMEECVEECQSSGLDEDDEDEEHYEDEEHGQGYSPVNTVEELIEAATNYLDTGLGVYFDFDPDVDWPRFWESYVTLTSRYVPPGKHDLGFFSCAC
jgi:uncharacterized protein (TIGR02996 family)